MVDDWLAGVAQGTGGWIEGYLEAESRDCEERSL